MLGEEHGDVEVPDAALVSEVVLGAALDQGGEPMLAPPGSQPAIACEELVDLEGAEPAEASQVIQCERLIGPSWVVGHVRQACSIIAASERVGPPQERLLGAYRRPRIAARPDRALGHDGAVAGSARWS